MRPVEHEGHGCRRLGASAVSFREARESTHLVGIIQLTVSIPKMPLFLGEGVPEPQCLVTRTCHDRLTVRAHSQVEHTVRMSGERRDHIQ